MATTVEERISRIEGTLDHLATKADIAELRGEMRVLLTLQGVVLIGVFTVLRFLV